MDSAFHVQCVYTFLSVGLQINRIVPLSLPPEFTARQQRVRTAIGFDERRVARSTVRSNFTCVGRCVNSWPNNQAMVFSMTFNTRLK